MDFGLEEEVARNPYALKSWLAYIAAKDTAKPQVRFNIYERALKVLPGSYKLWHAYLMDRRKQVSAVQPFPFPQHPQLHAPCAAGMQARGLPPNHEEHTIIANAFERALVTMHKMPVIWYAAQAFLCGFCSGAARWRCPPAPAQAGVLEAPD